MTPPPLSARYTHLKSYFLPELKPNAQSALSGIIHDIRSGELADPDKEDLKRSLAVIPEDHSVRVMMDAVREYNDSVCSSETFTKYTQLLDRSIQWLHQNPIKHLPHIEQQMLNFLGNMYLAGTQHQQNLCNFEKAEINLNKARLASLSSDYIVAESTLLLGICYIIRNDIDNEEQYLSNWKKAEEFLITIIENEKYHFRDILAKTYYSLGKMYYFGNAYASDSKYHSPTNYELAVQYLEKYLQCLDSSMPAIVQSYQHHVRCFLAVINYKKGNIHDAFYQLTTLLKNPKTPEKVKLEANQHIQAIIQSFDPDYLIQSHPFYTPTTKDTSTDFSLLTESLSGNVSSLIDLAIGLDIGSFQDSTIIDWYNHIASNPQNTLPYAIIHYCLSRNHPKKPTINKDTLHNLKSFLSTHQDAHQNSVYSKLLHYLTTQDTLNSSSTPASTSLSDPMDETSPNALLLEAPYDSPYKTALDTLSARAYQLLAFKQEELNNFELAAAHYQASIRLSTGLLQLNNYLFYGVLLHEQKNFETSNQALQHALNHPQDSKKHLARLFTLSNFLNLGKIASPDNSLNTTRAWLQEALHFNNQWGFANNLSLIIIQQLISYYRSIPS